MRPYKDTHVLITFLILFSVVVMAAESATAQANDVSSPKGHSTPPLPGGMELPLSPDKAGKVAISSQGGFDGGGRIDAIGEDFLVISDSQKHLASSVKYFDARGNEISSPRLEIGNTVRYLLNDKNEIVSLRLEDENRPVE